MANGALLLALELESEGLMGWRSPMSGVLTCGGLIKNFEVETSVGAACALTDLLPLEPLFLLCWIGMRGRRGVRMGGEVSGKERRRGGGRALVTMGGIVRGDLGECVLAPLLVRT